MRCSILVIAILFLLGLLLSPAAAHSLHDKTRGLKATGHTKEQIEAHAQYHKGDAAMRRLQAKDDLKEHPVVKDFLSWQENHKNNKPGAGGAWAGAMPHDFIPHMLSKEDPMHEHHA
eukprot:CAMPEP_0202341438 /NCGR_PEP_ID=MMETSP1126-20121109/2437_1 /ASSEMBLY_ACC=CAM_ASM_000457 /TAXON_ID=3047 /ORGANISM="Dunaliella tertiolecta, Strain CCMP1320" /LENGTH=116 /DNA_ID=CAMNT_0048932263 /DNA_START=23 /DNA_END=373 /DNA_ORIENTATION=-